METTVETPTMETVETTPTVQPQPNAQPDFSGVQSEVQSLLAQLKGQGKNLTGDAKAAFDKSVKSWERKASNLPAETRSMVEAGAISARNAWSYHLSKLRAELLAELNPNATALLTAQVQAETAAKAVTLEAEVKEHITQRFEEAGLSQYLRKSIKLVTDAAHNTGNLFSKSMGGVTVTVDGTDFSFPNVFDAVAELSGVKPRRSKSQLNAAYASLKRLTGTRKDKDGNELPAKYGTIVVKAANGEILGNYAQGRNFKA